MPEKGETFLCVFWLIATVLSMTSTHMTIGYAEDIGDGRVQQDRFSISPERNRVVLCDGHGPHGHDYAQVACDFLIANPMDDTGRLFSRTNAHLKERFGDHLGGTTCTYVSFDADRTMRFSNIGYSSVRYWYSTGSGVGVTTDHSSTRLEEFMRIRNAGGCCIFDDQHGRYPKGQQSVFLPGDFFFAFNAGGGNYHKNCRNEWATYFTTPTRSAALAVTRAFGNWGLVPYGLLHEPAVRVVPPPSGAIPAVVIASDGLWDVMTDVDIGGIVRRSAFLESHDATGAAEALLACALLAGSPNQDNTSVIVAYVS